MEIWRDENIRRILLIEKKYREGLSKSEEIELERIRRDVYDHLESVNPRSTEILDEIDSRIDRIPGTIGRAITDRRKGPPRD